MQDFVRIYGTGKGLHMPEGVEYLEPKDMADALVDMGYAKYAKEKKEVSHVGKMEGEPNSKKDRKGK